jgi:primosomal protein N' (replication factor Y)
VSPRTVSVALPVAVDGAFTYALPADTREVPAAGTRVLVPFGSRVLVGVVRGPATEIPEPAKLRELLDVLDAPDAPALGPDLCHLCEWISDYYLAPVGEAYRLALPGLLTNADARVVSLTDKGRDAVSSLGAGPLLSNAAELSVDEPSERLLRHLAEHRAAVPVSKLTRLRPRVSSVLSRVAALCEAELCELEWGDKLTTGRTELHLQRTDYLRGPNSDEEVLRRAVGRSKPRRALLDHLDGQSARWVPLSELRAIQPRARQLATKLIESRLVITEDRLRPLDPFAASSPEPSVAQDPTPDQAAALEILRESVDAQRFACHLLHGITGSGKTEVYLQTIERVRARGGGAIVLVPEIALTPQLADRFRARFGDEVAVLHSGLDPRQRVDAWEHIRRGLRPIVVGARSAVFAPVPRLEAIVVDEEHDGSFKQEEGVRYNARDVALVRARQVGATVILGSATPSLETYAHAAEGRYRRLELLTRPTPRPLPSVELLPLSVHRPDSDTMMSARLRDAVAETVAAGDQAILFLNRRGYTTTMSCQACGALQQCPDCSAPSMTYHFERNRLVCHLCSRIESAPRHCLACGEDALVHGAAGTERIELAIAAALPEVRVLRLDRDTSRGRRLVETLNRFRRREIDVLVGTQMLSKGHDFPGVTLVGILQGDHGLGLPDLRASERTFQLLTQVGGRAGRGERPGHVMIQAYAIDQPAIQLAAKHDYAAFAAQELDRRRLLRNPPFGHLALLRIQGPQEGVVRSRASRLHAWASTLVERANSGEGPGEDGRPVVELLPVAPAPIERINRRTRWQMLFRSARRAPLRWVLGALRPSLGTEGSGDRSSDARVDVDPQSLM